MYTKYLKILFLIGIFCLNFTVNIYSQKSLKSNKRSQVKARVFGDLEKTYRNRNIPQDIKEKLRIDLIKSIEKILDQSAKPNTSLKLKVSEEQLKQKTREDFFRKINKSLFGSQMLISRLSKPIFPDNFDKKEIFSD